MYLEVILVGPFRYDLQKGVERFDAVGNDGGVIREVEGVDDVSSGGWESFHNHLLEFQRDDVE